jgi:phage shock protein PspC (stress-responsive transcriptional regulator)
MEKRLCRSRQNRMLAGVCGGIAEYLGWDPTLVRVAWIVLTLLGGSGILIYLIFWLVMPESP